MVLSYHSMMIDSFGSLWASGSNLYGQLGIENRVGEIVTTPVKILPNILSVATGLFHTVCLTVDNKVLVFGLNDRGQLGLGHQDNTVIPRYVEFKEDVKIVKIECGLFHSIAIDSNGDFWVWGDNSQCQCGVANYHSLNDQGDVILKPLKIISNDLFKVANDVKFNKTSIGNSGVIFTDDIIDMSCGNNFTLLRKNNQVIAFGSNSNYQLSSETSQISTHIPITINQFLPNNGDINNPEQIIINMVAAEESVFIHSSSGKIYALGKINIRENGIKQDKIFGRFIRLIDGALDLVITPKGILITRKGSDDIYSSQIEYEVIHKTSRYDDPRYPTVLLDYDIIMGENIIDFSPGVRNDIYINDWKYLSSNREKSNKVEDLVYTNI